MQAFIDLSMYAYVRIFRRCTCMCVHLLANVSVFPSVSVYAEFYESKYVSLLILCMYV